jgi:hypothetical protein
MTDLARRKELAQDVLGSLAHQPPAALELLAAGLAVAAEPLCEFAQPFSYFADVLADPTLSGELARLRMSVALRFAAWHPGCAGLLERLDGVDESPWPQLAAALVEVRGAQENEEDERDR